MEIPRGGALFFEGKYDTKIEFQFKLKNLMWLGYGYFLEQHLSNLVCDKEL